jgi:hypothetical protein
MMAINISQQRLQKYKCNWFIEQMNGNNDFSTPEKLISAKNIMRKL